MPVPWANFRIPLPARSRDGSPMPSCSERIVVVWQETVTGLRRGVSSYLLPRRSSMSQRLALVVGLGVLLFAAAAQAEPKAELFGGYQYTHPDGGPSLNGWNGALTGNFNKTFGITADFSGS